MIEWFEALNPSLQGVVIGSTLSIAGTTIGVVLTNAFNFYSLRKQQIHDRSQKSLERVATLRRTVYLDAAEALGAGLSLVARQGHLALTDLELFGPYSERSPALARVYLTANEETAEALAKYTASFRKALLTLSADRNVAAAARQRILDLRKLASTQRNQAADMHELQKRWFIEADKDQSKHAAMGHAGEYHLNQATAYEKQADDLVKPLQQRHFALMDMAQRENLRLSLELLPFIVSVRKELESPIDEGRFREIFSAVEPMSEEQIKKMLGI